MAILKHNNNSISNVTSFAQVPAGDMKLLSTATASSSASLSFNSTYINSDYKIYKFEFINCNPATDGVYFQMNLSTDNGSNYNVVKTTTWFTTYHNESGSGGSLSYGTGNDLAQSSSDQYITGSGLGNASDESVSGCMYLFNPSSTTYVKHFMSNINYYYFGNETGNSYMAGYGNTTSAINATIFRMSSGNFDGQIKLYGIGAN